MVVNVLLISGSTWAESLHNRLLRRLHRATWPYASTALYDGLLDLPAFVPGAAREPVAARDLLDRVDRADAVLFCSPEYLGAIPGATGCVTPSDPLAHLFSHLVDAIRVDAPGKAPP